jgi:hypothetical protein
MKTIYTLFAVTLILVACGRTQVTGNQAGTDLCNTQFINAYNGLVIKADEAKELEKSLSPDKETAKQQIKRYIQQFRLKLIDFKSRYPAVNCKAQNTKDKKETYIDSNAVANRYWDILDNMEKEINDK